MMIPLNADFSLLSLNDKECFNDTTQCHQINLPVDQSNSLLATTQCYDRLYWQGQLQLALLIRDRCVRIQVIQARYLQVPVDEGYSMFVEIRIAPKHAPHCTAYQLRTKSVPDCTAPVFNEKFSFEISHVARNHRIYIELYLNQSKFGYENAIFLGGMSFDIKRLKQKSEKSIELLNHLTQKSVNLLDTSVSREFYLQKRDLDYISSERSSISLPSVINIDDFSKPQWYYLLGKSSCYRRHMSVVLASSLSKGSESEKLSFLASSNSHNTESLTSEMNKVMNPSASVSTISSLHGCDNRDSALFHSGDLKRLQITIPKSADSGYGFTLTTQMAGFNLQQFASTPLTSPTTNQTTLFSENNNSLPMQRLFRIHSVRKNSPADLAGLPVGAYLLGIGNQPLDCTITLKEVVRWMYEAAESHPDKAVILDIGVPNCQTELPSQNNSKLRFSEKFKFMVSSGRHNQCTTVKQSITESVDTGNTSSNSYLPRTVTPASTVMLCEERCIDEDLMNDETINNLQNRNESSSLSRRRRMLTLAPPILKLKWQDVCLDEANRQWAVERLLTKLTNTSNDLMNGIKAYRTGLQNIANFHPDDLNALFHNIVEIGSETCKMKQNLQNGCLPYDVSTITSSSSDPLARQYAINNKSKSRFSISSTPSPLLPLRNDSYRGSNTNTLTNNNSNNNNNTGLLDGKDKLDEYRRNSSGTIMNSKNNSHTTQNGGIHKRLSFLFKLPRQLSEDFKSDNSATEQLCQQDEPRKQMMITQQDPSSCNHQLNPLNPPVHGHLDNPGTIILMSLNDLLHQCMDYTNVYPDRLKYIYQLRKHFPELRLFLKSQAMQPDVPILSLFLTLPLEIPRYLLSELKNIEKYTSAQHKDRPALEKCIQALNEALNNQSSPIPPNDIDSVNNLILKDVSYLSNTQCPENDHRSKMNTSHIFDTNKTSPSTGEAVDNADSPVVYPKKSVTENTQLAKLMKYLLPPLFPYPNDSETFSPSEWSSVNHHIIYKSYLLCTLCSKQYPDLIKEDVSYRGPVFAYLLNDALLLVVSEKDVLETCRPSCLAYEPILLDSIAFQDYEISALSFMLKLKNGTTFQFDCTTFEIKLVWKTLIEQQMTTK
ncbi:unnamed protein product [Trichobilharzia szidati]|nr:unnamed protein product [Trichobilharzia szidati]